MCFMRSSLVQPSRNTGVGGFTAGLPGAERAHRHGVHPACGSKDAADRWMSHSMDCMGLEDMSPRPSWPPVSLMAVPDRSCLGEDQAVALKTFGCTLKRSRAGPTCGCSDVGRPE